MWFITLFPKILNMSLTAGFVIVLVLLARLLLRKAPKVFSYALWAVVLFRLLCPLTFESPVSIVPDTTPITSEQIEAVIPSIPFQTPANIASNRIAETENPDNPVHVSSEAGGGVIITFVWLFGIVAMLIYSIFSLLRLKRKLIGAVPLRENIYLADYIVAPFVIGVIRPKIYLPSTLSEREQEYIILHEQTHIRRFDHILKLVSFLALTLHWFNPLVWAAFILSGKDMEMSCDEAVMKKMDGDIRADYSASLLSLATGRKIFAGAPLAFGEGDTKSRIKNVMNYKKPAFWVVIAALAAVLAVCVGLAANPHNNGGALDSIAAKLLQYRTEYLGDNSKVGGIVMALEYPDKVAYSSFALDTESVTVNLDTDTETRNFYTGALNEGPFRKNAIIMFALIHNAEYITFELDDGTNPYSMQFTRDGVDMFVDGDIWSYSSSPEQFETLLQMMESIEVTEPEPWNPQPEYENQDDYFEALEAARAAVKPEEIAVDDKGQNEKTALAWMEAYLGMYKALPKDNMAYIAQGVVDRLEVIKVSKEGLPKAFVFSVTFSVRPTYPIAQGGFWAAGNTTDSPGRDETWGQHHIEVELRLEDDGKYHFVYMGSGAVGSLDAYDMVKDKGTAGEEYDTPTSAAERAQAVLDSVVSGGTVAMTLTAADGMGGGRYEVPLEYGNGRNRVSGFDSSFNWSYIKSSPFFSPGSVSSLKVESPDGAAAIQCWQGSNLVLCTLDGESFRFSAGVLGSDAVFDGTIFTYLRFWYDEAEISGLRGDIVIPDKGQSYQEIAQAWTDAYEGAMLRTTAGSKYACTYVKTTASVKEDSMDSWYPAKALETEHFYFDYSTVFVRDNDQSNWLMAGNTADYKGNDAPAGALKYYLMGPMYLTEEGWRCDGVGTGP